jgi:hypothetical protein
MSGARPHGPFDCAQDEAYVCGRTGSRENILGHVEIRVTQNFPEILRPCGFDRPSADMHDADA